MNAALNFNTAAPETDLALTRQVSIGWEHTVVDGQVVYTLDDAGEPVARTYLVPARLTARQLIERTQAVTPDLVERLTRGELDAILQVTDALVGEGVVESVGTDPTVGTEAFLAFVTAMLTELGGGSLGVSPGNS